MRWLARQAGRPAGGGEANENIGAEYSVGVGACTGGNLWYFARQQFV